MTDTKAGAIVETNPFNNPKEKSNTRPNAFTTIKKGTTFQISPDFQSFRSSVINSILISK